MASFADQDPALAARWKPIRDYLKKFRPGRARPTPPAVAADPKTSK